MPLLIVLLSCANVVSRSSLNIIDRLVFSKSKIGFLRLYFFANVLPLFLGFFILACFEIQASFWSYFLTVPCALLALSTHLVGMSFSYAFRHCEVRQVVIKAKMPEFFFAFASCIPFMSNKVPLLSLGLKTYVTLIATLIGLFFIWSKNRSKIFSLFDRTGLCIISTILVQMMCASFVSISAKTLEEIMLLTVAMLLWRCCLMLPLIYVNGLVFCKKDHILVDEEDKLAQDLKGQSWKFFGMLSFRAILALITQLTFTWCVLKGSPLLIWPIFNTTPLVASIASQLILKEHPHWSEIMALLCFFLGSTCTVFL